MGTGWSADEVRDLRFLRLDPVKNPRDKLVDLVRHFKGPKPSVWAVTAGAREDSVSRPLAAKVRDLTREGKLDWLLQDEGSTSLGSGRDIVTISGAASKAQEFQMELSGHWPGLRKAAATLDEQLWAPVPQLLALSNWDAWNDSLEIDCSGGRTNINLKIEEAPLFRGLKEHFPAHDAWTMLEDWKGRVGFVHGQLPVLSKWVGDQLGGSDHSKFHTERFAPTIVSNAVEGVLRCRPVDDFYRRSAENEYEISRDDERWLLTLVLVGVRYVIARSGTREDLDGLKRRHIELREKIRDLPELAAIVAAYRQVYQIEDDLRKELEQTNHLAIFPGRCGLCNG